MSTTRAEILEALTACDKGEGLTSKELAPRCPSADCDEMIVGRCVATLKAEHVIKPIGLREGATVYAFGAPPAEETVERVTLPESGQQPKREISEAARVIAAMRKPITGSGPSRASAEPNKPQKAHARTSAPATAPVHKEVVMKEKKTVAERVIDALTAHGQCNTEQLAKYTGSTKASLSTMLGKVKGVERVSRGIYALAGAKQAPPLVRKPRLQKKGERKSPIRIGKDGKREQPRIAPPAAPKNGANGHEPQFAINEHGELGIDAGEQKVRLGPDAFLRLREFIERTKPVWEGASA